MSDKNLVFFNKEGDSLNFSQNNTGLYQGDIIFHENSSDTFKTYGLYMMEKIPGFEFESPGELTTRRFQLFNELGINFYGTKFKFEKIKRIEPVNDDPNFNSKWIYGDNFESKFPIGTLIKFDSVIFEFGIPNLTYTVVSSKKNAIMIISGMDNLTFDLNYLNAYSDDTSYIDKTISGVNAIGIYDYVDSNFDSNLSSWNEDRFYALLDYNGRKLNIVNSNINDSIVTVDNIGILDQNHFDHSVNSSDIPQGSDFIIEIITRTDVPKIFSGQIVINSANPNKIFLGNYPQILKPGTVFKIVGSSNNSNFITVSDIPNWNGIVNETFFELGAQVQFQNLIFECINSYTQSFADNNTAFITPLDTSFWSQPTYISTEESLIPETIAAGIYLTSDRYYFTQEWSLSSESTMQLAVEKFREDIQLFNIDLSYQNNSIKADLIYSSKYADVNFYYNSVSPSNKIGKLNKKNERIIGIREDIKYEINKNYSENFKYNIVFTDIDNFGFKITINGMVYDIEASIIFSGASIDMERTIDRTIKNWFNRYYFELYKLGINVYLQHTGQFKSFFNNSIVIKTHYPNVPINIDNIQVGITGDFYIEYLDIIFNEIGPFFSININNRDYAIEPVYDNLNSNIVDVDKTLNKWFDEHNKTLLSLGVIVVNIRNVLYFRIKVVNRTFDIKVKDGLVDIPGVSKNIIIKKQFGNNGCLLTSNEILLLNTSLDSFLALDFSTGMITSINNTFWVFNNQEYNIIYLDSNRINLSYEGPFWGLTELPLSSSPFKAFAFSTGFSEDPLGIQKWQGFTFSNSIAGTTTFNPNTYSVSTFTFDNNIGLGFVDIKYIQLSSKIYGFGQTHLVIRDAVSSDYLGNIELIGNSDSIKMVFNGLNNFLYLLSKNILWIIDIINDRIFKQINLTSDAYDLIANPLNGDIYVSYLNAAKVDIWAVNNFNNIPTYIIDSSTDGRFPATATSTGKMVFNDFERDMYITVDGATPTVIRVNTTRDIQTKYDIPNLELDFIYYEPVNESIYVYGGNPISLVRIDDGLSFAIPNISLKPHDFIFNSISGDINISSSDSNYRRLSVIDNSVLTYNIGIYGYLAINQFDESVYLANAINPEVSVINNGVEVNRILFNDNIIKIIYNPERRSMWGIEPLNGEMIEIKVAVLLSNDNNINGQKVGENLYGTLDDNYKQRQDIWLKTRDYIRRPRENFEGDVRIKYYWRWLLDDTPEIFMYDFSGDQLATTGDYRYIGPKPLTDVVLNRNPNKDLAKIHKPQYQQTIFDRIIYNIPYINDSFDFFSEPEPIQLFLGFKSDTEGVSKSTLQLFKKEDIIFDIISDSTTTVSLRTEQVDDDRFGVIEINKNSFEIFSNKGLKSGQIIVIYLNDESNNTNQYTSENNASLFIIRNVFTKTLILDFIAETDFLSQETTFINNYPSFGKQTYLKLTIKVSDKELARFNVLGQTEEEDERFKIELGNQGKLIAPDEVFIFKKYDILEGGIDWIFLNKKRKEMLMMKHLIYPYIGSYKSIINAINYFGYNDLKLNEYYRNIDPESENFFKLFKVEIPNIFNNLTIGEWADSEILKEIFPNNKFEETNLFNLTYQVTNKSGENVLEYTLDEVVIKLQGLKYWLQRNIIPLTHRIMDITGNFYVNSVNSIRHKLKDINIVNIKQEMSPISVRLNEAYLMPVNSGSTVYNCVLDFYSIIPGFGTKIDTNIKPFNGSILLAPESFTIKVRTYKTYKEWNPFKTYKRGDKVIVINSPVRIYESVIDNNRTKNPRKFRNASKWSANVTYKVATVVEYLRDFYVFSGLGATSSSIPPILDNKNWLNVTEWREIDREPVQTLREFRTGDNLLPFNFTIDSNLDPFITIEVISDNGYGQIYNDRKNYDIRGIKDLVDDETGIEEPAFIDCNLSGAYSFLKPYECDLSGGYFIPRELDCELDGLYIQTANCNLENGYFREIECNLSNGFLFNCTLSDGYFFLEPVQFSSLWRTTNIKEDLTENFDIGSSATNQVQLPLVNGGTYNMLVDWGDGTISRITSWNQTEKLHTYAIEGDYVIDIYGVCRGWQFPALGTNNTPKSGDAEKMLNIIQWGILDISTTNSFRGCINLDSTASDAPKISTNNLSYTFLNCTNFNGAIGNWDMSGVTNLGGFLRNCRRFNQDVGSWDVSNVTIMGVNSGGLDIGVFTGCYLFNNGGSPSINNWNTSNVTDMRGLFWECINFNQPLNNWDVSKVTRTSSMFAQARAFNQPLDNWDLGNVTNMSRMFFNIVSQGTMNFNQNIGMWNVSNVTNMSQMFSGAQNFNNGVSSDINNWDVSKVTNMQQMFTNAISFNQNIGGWDVGNVTNMLSMFQNATSFNNAGSPDINNWQVGKVTNMANMFANARNFNQNIGAWDVSKVAVMCSGDYGMFINAHSFNNGGSDTINNWDVSKVTRMSRMFELARAFNQPIGNWDVGNVTNMARMFFNFPTQGTMSFNQNISMWNVSNVTNMGQMFGGAQNFNNGGSPDINNWDVSSVTNMSGLFSGTAFNQLLDKWDVSKVTNMSGMFRNANSFNQDITGWNTSNVTSMGGLNSGMFGAATSFNQNISSWDVSEVTIMSEMFQSATSFNQNLGTWQLRPQGVNLTGIFGSSGMSCQNYTETIVGWANYTKANLGPLNTSMTGQGGRRFDGSLSGGTLFTQASDARIYLITETPTGAGWTVSGDTLGSC
jgi:surface protein